MKTKVHWENIGRKPHHGFVTPLSSIRTQKSYGVGEFLDLIPLIDFCKKVGFDTIQLLPINDMGGNTSPYSAISSCALDPIFLSLIELPYAKPLLKDIQSLKEFNQTKRVDFYEVKQQKLSWLYTYFKKAFPKVKETQTFDEFLKEHQSWLKPYAKFKGLRKHYQDTHWTTWPKKHPKIPQSEIEFHYFLQFCCFSQMEKAKKYAESQGCFLKGDIPILICSDSADLWHEKKYFFLDPVAGSPPDSFSRFGQKWNLPICNWEEMRKSNFSWWRRRLSVASHLYHIYRIDHVIGLFRFWAIPKTRGPLQGYYLPENRSEWESQGRELLEMMLLTTPALPIAEDLGIIPPEVPKVLKELGICGTKIMQWQQIKGTPIPLSEYEPFSLTTVSTHDSPTLEMWWRDSPKEAKLLCKHKGWRYEVPLSFERRFEILSDSHRSSSYFHINLLQEYLALFPELISENPEEERINIAGIVLRTNWTYRFKPTIEEMSSHKDLIKVLRSFLIPNTIKTSDKLIP